MAMTSATPIHAFSSAPRAQAVETRGASRARCRWRSQTRRLSALSYNAGITATDLVSVVSESNQGDSSVGFPVVRAAGSKQKKKVKDKKKSSWAENKQWKFDELMLVWDDVFSKVCEDSSIATALWELSRNGLSAYGRGCVLVQETTTTRPRGAASGFTFKSRYSSVDAPELPSYSSVQWVAEYLPKEFILDPSKAPVSSSDTLPASMDGGTVRVVDQGTLMSALRGMDRTRLLGLLADPGDLKDLASRDVGGEEPCNPSEDELVIMLLVLVDGQHAVGADVLKAFPTVEDGASGNPANLWTLRLRDDLPY